MTYYSSNDPNDPNALNDPNDPNAANIPFS